MAKYTLLEIVQKAIAYTDDENVNSVSDSVEAETVVHMTNQILNDILSSTWWPHKAELGNLEVTAVAYQMKLPADVLSINWIRYNKKDVEYLKPYDMQVKLDSRDPDLTSVDSTGAINDQDPAYWTTNDDFTITFDAYDSTLQSNLSVAEMVTMPSELSADADVPDLPERFHTTLFYGVVAEAIRTFKGDLTQASVYDKKYRDGYARMRRWARRVNGTPDSMPGNYGRRAGGSVQPVRIIIGSST